MELIKVTEKDRDRLWSMLQEYLLEMSGFYGDEPDENGIFGYRYFDDYFTDEKRMAFFLSQGEDLVGFVMLHPYSAFGGETDHVISEFTVLPAFRRRHLAESAADEIFRRYKGNWEIKYSDKNSAAAALWNRVTERYHPLWKDLSSNEKLLMFRVN